MHTIEPEMVELFDNLRFLYTISKYVNYQECNGKKKRKKLKKLIKDYSSSDTPIDIYKEDYQSI